MNIPERKVVKTYNKLHKLPLGSITAQGWLKEQLMRNKAGMGGHLDELEPDMIATPFINYSSFKRLPHAQGDADPSFAAGWCSEISGTYWTGLVQLAFTLNDPELIAKADAWIAGVLKHQEEDGYLGGYPKHTDRQADFNAWGSAWLYRAMLSYYEATGREEVLEAVHKGLLWFCENWSGDKKTDYVGAIITEPMLIVYALTGDRRLIDFASDYLNWLEDNSKWQNKVSQYLSDALPYTSMHTVAYGEDMKHPALVYCATGEEKLLQASLNATRKALARIVQNTGGAVSNQEFLGPKGATCETEYCDFATFSHSYSWLAMLTGQASWGDEIERILFNGAQGARKKDERAIAYMSAPNQLHANSRSSLFGSRPEMDVYSPCFNTACCPVQSVRIIPEFIRGMVMLDESNALHLFCYGPAAIRTQDVELDMQTLYPFRDTIELQVKKAENRKLYLRIPAWCKQPEIKLNGNSCAVNIQNGFALLDTPINTGDTLNIHFPMEVTITQIDDSHYAGKYPISIEYGPLVYALPVQAKWSPFPGQPITPLPEGWSWFNVNPDLSFAPAGCHPYEAYNAANWSKGIDETLDAGKIRVVEQEVNGYVWENPPITLEVPLYPVHNAYICVGQHTHETFEVPLKPVSGELYTTMVPHGCTNLRITYLPRIKKA